MLTKIIFRIIQSIEKILPAINISNFFCQIINLVEFAENYVFLLNGLFLWLQKMLSYKIHTVMCEKSLFEHFDTFEVAKFNTK